MKLIDILIEKDIEWPNGAEGVVQDDDGEVKFYAGEDPVMYGGVWVRDVGISEDIFTETATDYNTAIVTKQQWENRKANKEAMFADVKVGDNVWDSRQGWGVITELNDWSDYPITVEFVRDCETYTLDGYYDEDDVNPSLFWDEIEIKAPPKPLPELEVDAKVLVWVGLERKYKRHFSHFRNGEIHVFDAGQSSWTGECTTGWDNWELAE